MTQMEGELTYAVEKKPFEAFNCRSSWQCGMVQGTISDNMEGQ